MAVSPVTPELLAAFAAFMAEQADTPAEKPQRKTGGEGGRVSAKTEAARKPADKGAYKPTAAKRKEAATARQLWALNQAGLLVLDPDGSNKPVAFGVAFDCVAATRK